MYAASFCAGHSVEMFELVRLNLFSPMVLAFVLGIVATVVRSDLRIPEQLYTTLSIYLLLAIGLKGGAELSETGFNEFWQPALVTLALGIGTPVLAYTILRGALRLDIANAAAMAAHYGSVSAVTFAASQTFLDSLGVQYEGFMPTLVALLEVPAIVIALFIARVQLGASSSWGAVAHEIFGGKSILLLLGGLAIGFLAGKPGLAQVAPLFVDLFRGALTIFLLEMGMVAARRFHDLHHVGWPLVAFAILMPLCNGALGLMLGQIAGLSSGGTFVLSIMAASASYIAAPAAVRIALPQANPSYYLTAALGITFPFNLAIGIPLFYALAQWMSS
jgi:hypothetical protein